MGMTYNFVCEGCRSIGPDPQEPDCGLRILKHLKESKDCYFYQIHLIDEYDERIFGIDPINTAISKGGLSPSKEQEDMYPYRGKF